MRKLEISTACSLSWIFKFDPLPSNDWYNQAGFLFNIRYRGCRRTGVGRRASLKICCAWLPERYVAEKLATSPGHLSECRHDVHARADTKF